MFCNVVGSVSGVGSHFCIWLGNGVLFNLLI